ncbi:MFS transporter, partial [bacterium]|nr:MFS transporter [bacterium]
MSFGRIKNFIARQTDNFKVLLVAQISTTSIRSLTAGQAAKAGGGAAGGASYVQLYIKALGADSQQIGYLNSLGRVANAIVALPLGWISDRFSLRKVVLVGYLLSIITPITFAFAMSWAQVAPAMMIDAIATTLLGIFTTIFFITSIKETSDRATAMSMRTTITSIVGLVLPSLSAIVILNFGGIGVEGIRPLFFIEIFCSIFVFLYAVLKIKEVSFLQKKEKEQNLRPTQKKSFFQDYKEIASIPAVQKWTVTKCFRSFFV